MQAHRRSGIVAAALTLGILLATLWPVDDETATRGFRWCLTCNEQTLDIVLNILGFMPLGLALGRAGFSSLQAASFGLLLSAGIEGTQASLIAGRHGELRDVVTNTLGAGLGVWSIDWIIALWRPGALAPKLAASSALLFVGVTSGTAYLLQPAWPPYRIHGQAGPDRPPHPHFKGRLVSFEVAGVPVPSDRLTPESEAPIRAAIEARHLRTRATIASGPAAEPDEDAAPIALLVTGRRDVVRFAQVGLDAAFTVRTKGEMLGLRPFRLIVADVFRQADIELTLEGTVEPGAMTFAVTGPTGTDVVDVPLTTALGWAFVSPIRGDIRPSHELWSAIWLGCVALPMGFYSALIRRTESDRWRMLVRTGGMAAIAVTIGLALVPVASALRPSPPLHWLSAFSGVVAGTLLARLRNRG